MKKKENINVGKEERREEALITQLLGAAVSRYVVVADFLRNCSLSHLLSLSLSAANLKVRGDIRT